MATWFYHQFGREAKRCRKTFLQQNGLVHEPVVPVQIEMNYHQVKCLHMLFYLRGTILLLVHKFTESNDEVWISETKGHWQTFNIKFHNSNRKSDTFRWLCAVRLFRSQWHIEKLWLELVLVHGFISISPFCLISKTCTNINWINIMTIESKVIRIDQIDSFYFCKEIV